jgi:hypothetical protein
MKKKKAGFNHPLAGKRERPFDRTLGDIISIVIFVETLNVGYAPIAERLTELVGKFVKYPGRKGFFRVLYIMAINSACSSNPFHGLYITARAEYSDSLPKLGKIFENGQNLK